MPPKTLKIEDISGILDSKLEDLKKQLINELRENIMEDLKNEIKDMFVSQQKYYYNLGIQGSNASGACNNIEG